MQVNSATQTQYAPQAAKSKTSESKVAEQKDVFELSSETSDLVMAEMALGVMTAVLAAPVAIGAAAGGVGVGAVALGTAALCALAPQDDSEYPSSDNGLQSIALTTGLAAVGAIVGAPAAVTVGALGLAAGVAMWATAKS